MGEKVQEWLLGIVTGEKGRIVWAIVIILFLLAVIVYPYIDANFLYYDRLEKRIDNLQKLISISGNTIENNDALKAEFQGILNEIEDAREKTLINVTTENDSAEDQSTKFLGGSILFFVVGFFMIFQHQKGQKFTFKQFITVNIPASILCAVFGIIMGYIFTLFPTLWSTWINFFLAPVLELFVLWLFFGTSKKTTPANNP